MELAATNLEAALEAGLTRRIGRDRWEMWFKGKTRFRLVDRRLQIGVANRFLQEWLTLTFGQDIKAAVAELKIAAEVVVWVVDPELFRAARLVEERAAQAEAVEVKPTPLPKELFEHADGQALPFNHLRTGVVTTVRFLGELTHLYFHFDDGYRLCFGDQCRRCPDERHLSGFGDGIIAVRAADGQRRATRVIQVVPESALQSLQLPQLRGVKAEFLRSGRYSGVQVRILEQACASPLPDPINVRRLLMAKYNPPQWPVYYTPLSLFDDFGDLL